MARPKNDPQPPTKAPPPARVDDEQYHPRVGLDRVNEPPPPRIPSTPPFLLTWHEERWLVMGGQVIPELRKWKLRAGINGIEVHAKTGELVGASVRAAITEAETSHRVKFIPHDVDGPGTSYIRRPRGTDAHLLKWERTYSGSPQIECDEAGYVAWCRSLIERGIVSPPPLRVLERLRGETVKRLEAQLHDRGEDSTTARHRRQLEVIDREIELARQREGAVESEDVAPPMGV